MVCLNESLHCFVVVLEIVWIPFKIVSFLGILGFVQNSLKMRVHKTFGMVTNSFG